MGKISLSNIAEELAAKSGLTREVADNFMHAFVETIEKGLHEDGMVKVKGLGTFKLQGVSDRGSVDVNTGERITIKGYRKVTFTPDSTMKELVNRPFSHFEPTELNDGYPAEEEVSVSDSATDENEELELVEETVEEAVEAVAENVVGTVMEETHGIAEETAEANMAVEETVDAAIEEPENPVESIESIEEVTEPMEPAAEVAEESARELPEETVEPTEVAQLKTEARKRRGCGCGAVLLVLLILVVFVAVLAGFYARLTPASRYEELRHDETVEGQSDITVKPNLEEELGEEWGDGPKVKETQPTVENREKPVVPVSHPIVAETPKPQTADTIDSAPSAAPVADTTVRPVAVAATCTVTLTESLQAKAVKDITLADTTDYAITGTFTTHKLKSGETIIQLSNKYYGDKRLWPYIVKHNRMNNFNSVAIGQMIEIPVLKKLAE